MLDTSGREAAERHSRFFNKRAFDQAHAFYEQYGGVTIVLARFAPFLRTFAPFVAGVAQITFRLPDSLAPGTTFDFSLKIGDIAGGAGSVVVSQ